MMTGEATGLKRRRAQVLYGIASLCSGLVLLSGCSRGEALDAEVSPVEISFENHLDLSTPRERTGLVYKKGSFEYDCMSCHRSLKANWHLPEQLMEHRGRVLDHGNNRFCLNCHHPENRNVYVDYDGAEIPERDVVLLCSKCHGTQHRDWVAGVHGRQNGFWDLDKGELKKLACIECHDPHSPSFKAMEPMAAPTYPARAAGKLHPVSDHGEERTENGH